VIGDGKIFLVMESGLVAAQRVSDGSEAWHVELRTDQPVAVDGKSVFVASGEAIHALKTDDGAVVWRAPAGTLTAPLLTQDGWIVAASEAGLTAYRAADGTKVWSRETGAQHNRPSIEGDNLYVPLDDGRLLALDLRTGADRWKHTFARPPASKTGSTAPALSEVLAFADRVFVGSSDKWFYALNAADGDMAWRQRIGTTLRGRPAADASRIFVTAMDNVLRAFDRRSGSLLWHPSVPFRPTTGPVLIGTTVVVPGAAAEVRGFEAATGRPAGEFKLDEPMAISPAFGDSAGAAVMAAITGSLTGQWKLLLAESQRTLSMVPLTELPGVIVPIPPLPPKQ
jgi:outer membrane protein assembly factor BamB